MKSGIYLGPPIGRARRLVWPLLLLGSVATLVHVSSYVRQRGELGVLRERVERANSLGERQASERLGDDVAPIVVRLRAASASGVAVIISPTEVLQLIGNAVPDQVALVNVSFEPTSSPPSLLVEAVAQTDDDITALQKRVADSRRVSATQLLGERTAADGTLSVRLQVDLALER